MGRTGMRRRRYAMKVTIFAAVAALSLGAGVALADSLADNPPKSTTICLDTSGRARPVHCRAQASRLDAREDICICPAGTQNVKAPVCDRGVAPPPESAAFERERAAAVSPGSLMGATWHGQPMCVAPRNRGDY
jgi:hypothetical protein